MNTGEIVFIFSKSSAIETKGIRYESLKFGAKQND